MRSSRWTLLVCCVCIISFVLQSCRKDSYEAAQACDLQAGDLRISELMISPSNGDGVEWFEVFNASEREISIHRLVVNITGSGEPKHYVVENTNPVASKAFYVFGSEAAPYVDYVITPSASLNNTEGKVELQCKNVVVDTIAYGGDDGIATTKNSLIMDGSLLANASLKSVREAWCANPDPALPGGTPGYENPDCVARCINDGGVSIAMAAPAPNEIVLSEIMADPNGADAGKEWVELANVSSREIQLNGVAMLFSNIASEKQRKWNIASSDACITVAPQQRIVLGKNGLEEIGIADYVKVAGEDIYNEAIEVKVLLGDVVLDSVVLPAPMSNVAYSRNDIVALAGIGNVEGCYARDSNYFDGVGTPGYENSPCGDFCLDNGGWRAINKATAGQLVITEVMANPVSGVDDDRDWFEVYSNANQAIDANNIIVKNVSGSKTHTAMVEELRCKSIAPSEYFLFSWLNAAHDFAQDKVAVVRGDDLYATSGNVLIIGYEDLVIDEATPMASKAAEESVWLRPGYEVSADGNDTADNWCRMEQSPADTPKLWVTPGAANVSC